MPTLRPRKRASASSSRRRRSAPATTIEPVSGPFEPGQHHQQRRFARAGRADQANRLAAPYMQVDVFEDMNPGRGAAERKIDAGRARWPDCAVKAGRSGDVVHETWCRRPRVESAPRSYGNLGRKVQRLAAALSRLPLAWPWRDADPASAAERTIKVVALGDSLTAGYQLPARRHSRCSSNGRSRPRGSRSRSPTPACPATPAPAVWPGSTGRCRTAPMR